MSEKCKKNKDLNVMDCRGLCPRNDNKDFVFNGSPIGSGMTRSVCQGQSGRSMVEMLGTLAIVGVLSVGAIGGYSYAMNKHRTNELIYEATKRAQWVGTQLELNNSAPSLNTFGNDSFGGGTFDSVLTSLPNNQIGIVVKDLKEAVCDNIKSSIGDNTVIRAIKDSSGTGDITCEENGTATLVFNRDLSVHDSQSGGQGGNEPEPEEPQEPEEQTIDCGVHGEQQGNACVCDSGWQGDDCSEQKANDHNCSGHGYIDYYTGLCQCNTGYYGYDCSEQTTKTCADNGDCDGGYFCNYNSNVDATDGPSGQAGKCVKVSGVRGGTKSGYTWSHSKLDWFSAENFCDAQSKQMIDIDDFNCPYSESDYKSAYCGYCCATQNNSIYTSCNDNFSSGITDMRSAGVPYSGWQWYWTKTPASSGFAFGLTLIDGLVSNYSRNNGYYVLCE